MCCGNSCGENLPLFNYLKQRTEEAFAEGGASAVRVNRAGCFDVCMQGPIMVVYPGGVWYCRLTESGIDRIVEEHFKHGEIVADLAFHEAVKG